jgi:hypothetical protein
VIRDWLTTVSKELLQHFRAATRQNSATNLDFVVQLRVIQDLHYGMHRARFGIIRAVYQALDPCVHHGSSAHSARFNCNKELAMSQTMVTNGSTGFAQSDDLGVRGWVGVGDISVPSAADDAAIAHHDRAHRNFSSFEGSLGAAERLFHPEFVLGTSLRA